MYKLNLKTKLTLFATLQDKQSRQHCKTIGKNLHRHFLPCRLPTSKSHTQFINCWLLTHAALSIRSHLWWQCGGGRWTDSRCPSHTFTSTFLHGCGWCARRRPIYTPAWCISTPDKVGVKTIFNPLTTQLKFLTEFGPNHAVPCEFCQSTICHLWIPEGNPAPNIYRSGSQLTAPNYVQQTKQ